MISIITCSRRTHIDSEFEKNIHATIGVPHEIIWIDNSENKYSMCGAYNEGVTRAKGDILCFMHEDIIFHSIGWGQECYNELEDPDVWMLGVQGTKYLDATFAYWYPTPYITGHEIKNGQVDRYNSDTTSQDVVAVDGMWICMKREAFEQGLRWDEETFARFDMYDMDMSMQVIAKGKKIRTAEGVNLEHLSNGNFTQSFYESCVKFHDKWDHTFPVASFPITEEVVLTAHRFVLNRMNKYEYEDKERRKKLEKWPISAIYKIYKRLK